MHSKRKGNIGQFAVALKLAEYGFSVFTEEGDISKIDLIAEKDGKLLRFQCKALNTKFNSLQLNFYKSGPNYSFRYDKNYFDYFGVYDLTNGGVYFVPSSVLDGNNSGIFLRVKECKNNQIKNIHFAKDYLPEVILKDYL